MVTGGGTRRLQGEKSRKESRESSEGKERNMRGGMVNFFEEAI